MPIYLIRSAPETIGNDAMREIAGDITDIHCAVTGAPREFVHVFFLPIESVDLGSVAMLASIRSGRTDAQKAELRQGVIASFAHRATVTEANLTISIVETPASWVMEGGDIFPEPGEEAEWLAAHAQAKAARETAS